MPRSGKMTILIVDDTEVNRYVVSRTLERAGFQVISASTGEEGIQFAHRERPDLAVLDIRLPDMSGLEVCRRIKSDPATASMPVLHLSAIAVHSDDRIAGLDSGADAYLTQPVDARELLATINSLLRVRRAEDALRRIQWLLHRSVRSDAAVTNDPQPYADLTRFNTRRLLLDTVGTEMLHQIAGECLDLLDTSVIIHESNGDYALNILASPWCRFIDVAARRCCSSDPASAADCCSSMCHQSCWQDAARPAIEQRHPMDVECRGGIHVYALPILAGNEVVGSIQIGYGDPPASAQKLQELAQRYGVSVEQLKEHARAYESRPPFIIDVAKKRLHTAARLIGEIVERRRTEHQLKQAKEAAEQANRAKDQFLAVLSHELRTPLAPVITALSLVQEGQLDEPAIRETMEIIRRNVEMEAQLIDDLLDVTRIVRGKIELDRRPVLLRRIVDQAVEVCREDIEKRHLHFGIDLDDCGQLLVNADPARLRQVFWNLLKNAAKFTPEGGCIGIRCRQQNGQVVTEVTDSGEGIAPELLPRLFDPFEQGGARVTRQFGGLGLGLTITRGIVKLHGGTIEAYSAGKGKGATFTVRLPLCLAGELAPAGVRGEAPPAQLPLPSAQTHKPRILLVEDHGDTAKVMRRLLKARGYEVETAGDVATGLRLAEERSFDLLLSDLGLPDGSGLDLVRTLREHGRTLPAIALSGYGQEEDIRRSKEAGFSAHLTKPTNPDLLTRTITTTLHPGTTRP